MDDVSAQIREYLIGLGYDRYGFNVVAGKDNIEYFVYLTGRNYKSHDTHTYNLTLGGIQEYKVTMKYVGKVKAFA